MSSKQIIFACLILILPFQFCAQSSDLRISGTVTEASTGKPLHFVNINELNSRLGCSSDSAGGFSLIIPQSERQHVLVSYPGFQSQEFHLSLVSDTALFVQLEIKNHLLPLAEISAAQDERSTQESSVLNQDQIAQNSNQNLASILASLSGVSVIGNGSSISKPVIQGLFGNRLTLLNNGIPQSGQQWGVDHSPEIDPLMANKITVIRGVGTVEYLGSSLGGIVLIESTAIEEERKIGASGQYVFESNGFGHGLNLKLEGSNKLMAWRIAITGKKSGDRKSSSYYLRNTGNQEGNLALQLEKTWNDRLFTKIYLSTFNTEIGILRGSHIGNLTDLEDAYNREVPFYTEDNFSYSIDAPSQTVNHHLAKIQSVFKINDRQRISLDYAFQNNRRKEYDVRRSGRSELPAMSLDLKSHYFELKYRHYLSEFWKLKTGAQYKSNNNINIPGTGISPLIPNYISDTYGLFALLVRENKRSSIELGGRYDFVSRRVATISSSIPREVVRYREEYENLSASSGFKYEFTPSMSCALNVGYAERNPEVNELYSNGLHQGVSGIEEGDPQIKKERSTKSTFSWLLETKKRFSIQTTFFYQHIDDYIYLSPQGENRLTIRGAFPVFRYEQTNARLMGYDLSATFALTDELSITGKYSFLQGDDRRLNIPLVYMPANNLYAEVNYQIGELIGLESVHFQVNGDYVFEQKNILPEQDFLAAPEAYYLLGLKISADKNFTKSKVNLFAKAENLLNASYRSYLNRQRYFADDLGINFILGIKISL